MKYFKTNYEDYSQSDLSILKDSRFPADMCQYNFMDIVPKCYQFQHFLFHYLGANLESWPRNVSFTNFLNHYLLVLQQWELHRSFYKPYSQQNVTDV